MMRRAYSLSALVVAFTLIERVFEDLQRIKLLLTTKPALKKFVRGGNLLIMACSTGRQTRAESGKLTKS